MRTLRTMFTLAMLVTGLFAMQAATAATAEAAVVCKFYDGWHHNGQLLEDQRICAAPASDYPRYAGWGRIVTKFTTDKDPCGFNLFPYDIDDPQPMIACIAMVRPVQAWKWTSSGWKSAEAYPGQQVYVYPYATGWRWVWTQETGWLAVQEQHVAYRWLA